MSVFTFETLEVQSKGTVPTNSPVLTRQNGYYPATIGGLIVSDPIKMDTLLYNTDCAVPVQYIDIAGNKVEVETVKTQINK
jgi:hypothetical protein